MTAPPKRLPVVPAPELSAASKADFPPGLGAAYRRWDCGAVLACWPGEPRSTYSNGSRPYFADGQHDLVALFTAADCKHLATYSTVAGSRRLAYAQSVAADRARSRAHLLRDLRRGSQPPGSVTMVTGYPAPLVRFPDGRGCFAMGEAPEPWKWRRRGLAVYAVLALDLSKEQCLKAAAANGRAEVEAVLAGVPPCR